MDFREHFAILFRKSIVTFSILDEKSSDFLQKLVLVEISSKTRSFDDILILGDPIPYLLLGTFTFSDFFRNPDPNHHRKMDFITEKRLKTIRNCCETTKKLN